MDDAEEIRKTFSQWSLREIAYTDRLKKLREENALLRRAIQQTIPTLQQGHTWLATLGEHTPAAIGGEAKLDQAFMRTIERLQAILRRKI